MTHTTRALLVAASLILAGVLQAAPANWSPLLEATTLSQMLNDDIRIIHITGDYAQGHIPGAVHTPYPSFRGPQENPGQLPPLGDLTRVVQEAAITAQTPVVVVHQGSAPPDMGAATRVYWTLKSLGVADVAVLNGGFDGWSAAGLLVSTENTTVAPSSFEPRWNDAWQASAEEILQTVDGDTAQTMQIVDSRPAPFFLGEQAAASRAGTIPGAVNQSFEQFFSGTRMLSPSEVSAIVETSDVNAEPTVTFCNTGQLGSIGWFVLSELAGIDNVRLYAESITEWADKGYPMVNGAE